MKLLYGRNYSIRPERAEALSPGRCPGLRASALSGRAVGELLPFTFSLRPVTVGSGRAVGELLPFTFPFGW